MKLHVFDGFLDILTEVGMALVPLFIFFALFQVFMLKLPRQRVFQILLGFILTFFGLAFFLQGVHVGFFPIGQMMGESLGEMPYPWIIIPIGFVLGFVATFAEPAVSIMNDEVDRVTGGYISAKLMLYTVSTGVGISVALSMVRILFGIPLWYFLIPGYLLAFILVFFSQPIFTAIAFDSGGVSTGPMTVTFISAMAVGVASVTEGRDPLVDGFGLIALVALTPILAVLILGLIFTRKGGAENDESES
ncbi:hypothetical protein AC739_00400 [Planococcus glaciei]|uniref:DUF1538 domain-containing protein n=1 Tax=Planococcus glaciei TaxID=459472 RepID=A0A7H8Q7K8_9BACL|nr:DUF1538 domain-containing protein [Planococcus glaciei]KOF12013.1 hypothetical protein AC739_00400 [Planococcus glaciei]MBX0314557.1 DUF1538 domain-containing protein [Planococcus glaciei]MCP2034035.1 hypothetical protein [Planomicrobium sp. HSC-17F08]QKX49958.1 DUF1538 domain-containing protein [Planococcus glaciei]